MLSAAALGTGTFRLGGDDGHLFGSTSPDLACLGLRLP